MYKTCKKLCAAQTNKQKQKKQTKTNKKGGGGVGEKYNGLTLLTLFVE